MQLICTAIPSSSPSCGTYCTGICPVHSGPVWFAFRPQTRSSPNTNRIGYQRSFYFRHFVNTFQCITDNCTVVLVISTVYVVITLQGVIEFSLSLFFAKFVSYTFLYWLPDYIRVSGVWITETLPQCTFDWPVTCGERAVGLHINVFRN